MPKDPPPIGGSYSLREWLFGPRSHAPRQVEIASVDLGPEDILVLSTSAQLSAENVSFVREHLTKAIEEKAKVIVLPADFTLSVVRRRPN